MRKYGEKVQRLPLNAGLTCPNREHGPGCFFCDETGSGFATFSTQPIRTQLELMKSRYAKKGIRKFIAYFQNYTNTYAPLEVLERVYTEALIDNRGEIVQLDVATRPDCLSEEVLDLLCRIRERFGVAVSLDVGLQTANYRTLLSVNRGHTLAEFIDAVVRAKRRDVEIVAHVILNLPGDDLIDVVETAKILSALEVDGVKMHSLYVVEGSVFGEMFRSGELDVGSVDDYVERAVSFLEHLSPRIVIHRLVADPPRAGTLFGNWGKSKMELVGIIERRLAELETYQGKKSKIKC